MQITSPGFPYNSGTPCEYFLMVEAGKKVNVEILLLEANSCCDSLTIYDGYLGGDVLVSLTGEVYNVNYTTTSSNIMKVAWQPNGGINVLGLAMTFRAV
ncbi:hypothetical protein PRIPAC_83381 [Pristionchus pacificus]|uniref:CUB domain-containing protein n=1 Tax=Pristionchus pacificus TaxID=54126 RepID=A0A2A6BRP2_PRIPA|nr:hypothetical protein PRIPAC_83381 [Pristionchus pacificus]|eukprot:PDM68622.1 CUB domain-containing protein [Pristionchus pacificus]